jgi:pimeloyl-ACP methyl ester carboxylesterase
MRRVAIDHRLLRWLIVAIFLAALPACSTSQYVKIRNAPRNALTDTLQLASWWGPRPSDRTMQLLRKYDLHEDLDGDPKALLADFQKCIDQEPTAEKLHAFAELSYLAAKKEEGKNDKRALDLYGASVAYSYIYLFDEKLGSLRNPYDPQFRGACDLYNGALEGALRIMQEQGNLAPGRSCQIATETDAWDLQVVSCGTAWHDDDFEKLEFCSDYEVNGLTNQYHGYGLGVPMIAIRKKHEGESASEKYYPPGLSFPMTAFLRLLPDDSAGPKQGRRHRAVLELCDPLVSTDNWVGTRRVPLESDLSTPLAYFLNNPQLNKLSTAGLLRPDKTAAVSGLYMLEPYSPEKIPVLMVHGLWSSPLTWMEMFNDLRSDPNIRSRYQFWFYLYPTGQPFWYSAAQMRQGLAQMRQTIDPERAEPSLDQMVLVGHSMGGLISKLQAVESGNQFWDAVAEKPFHLVKASPETREILGETFYFHANPSVKRVITIGTPHRGSKFANETTRYLGRKLITLPAMLMEGSGELQRDNPGLFRDASFQTAKTSLDSLSPESPLLPVLVSAKPAPGVHFHNVIGVLPDEGIVGKLAGGTDGIVSYESAHLDGVDSEVVIQADHSRVHQHPLAVLEVRRILLEHAETAPMRPRSHFHLTQSPPPNATAPPTSTASGAIQRR